MDYFKPQMRNSGTNSRYNFPIKNSVVILITVRCSVAKIKTFRKILFYTRQKNINIAHYVIINPNRIVPSLFWLQLFGAKMASRL